MRSFYFTNKYGDWMFLHVGNIRGALRKAQDYANKYNELVIIKELKTHSILKLIYPVKTTTNK